MPSLFPRAPLSTRSRPHRGMRGFTLIEIVLAFSILAIGLTMAMQAATHAIRQARHAAEHSQAAMLAQNLLDAAGIDERLQLGDSSGEFGDSGYRWQLIVSEYEFLDEVDSAAPDLLVNSAVELLELDLLIQWGHGDQQREAHFQTLRAMLPDTLP